MTRPRRTDLSLQSHSLQARASESQRAGGGARAPTLHESLAAPPPAGAPPLPGDRSRSILGPGLPAPPGRGPRAQPGDLGLSRRIGAADAASLPAPGPRSPDQQPGAHPTVARRTASRKGQPRRGRALPLWRSPRAEGVAPAVLPHLSPFPVKAVHELIYLHVIFYLLYMYTHTFLYIYLFYM